MAESKYSRKLKEKLGGWIFGRLKNVLKMFIFWKSAGYILRKLKRKGRKK